MAERANLPRQSHRSSDRVSETIMPIASFVVGQQFRSDSVSPEPAVGIIIRTDMAAPLVGLFHDKQDGRWPFEA